MRSLSYIVPRTLRKVLNPPAIDSSILDKTSKCDIGSVINCSSLGRYSYIGEHSSLMYTDVGSFCSISNYCAIGGASHPIDWVSTSPVFNNTRGMMKIKLGSLSYEPFVRTVIGNDVWIGSHCLIKGGVHISDGAVIGMGSVITHDVKPYEIWVGNPARCIRKRFDDLTILKLLEIKWWDMNEEDLMRDSSRFADVEKYIKAMDKSIRT